MQVSAGVDEGDSQGLSERERDTEREEFYQHPQPHALPLVHWLPVFPIFCLLPPLQMLQEHQSFLGISGITESSLV